MRRRYRRAAVIGAALLVVGAVAVFVKRNPFANPFQLRAEFASAAQLTNGSQVRIAGIQVGRVSGIAAGPGRTALVTMQIDAGGLPLHDDATFTVKPRLVLEGNAYVDVAPGSPDAPDLGSGALVPIGRTAISVQLDQVLDVFSAPARDALQSSVGQLASGLGSAPSATPGYVSLRNAVTALDGALPPTGAVAHALGGTQPGDLSRAIGSASAVTGQLARSPTALAELVTSYNQVVGALATEDQPLAASISGIDQVLTIAPRPLHQIDAALPTLTRFSGTLRPALRAAPVTLRDTNRLLDQIGSTVRPAALPALLRDLSPVLRQLHPLEQRVQTLFSYSSPVTGCIATHVVPTLTTRIQDGANSTGDPVYLDLMHLFTGLTSFSSAVDGNGGTVRLGVTTGDRIVDTVFPGLGQVVGRLPNVDGVRPAWLGFGVNPPYRPDQPCASQSLPDLNTAAASGPLPAWASLSGTRPLMPGTPRRTAGPRHPGHAGRRRAHRATAKRPGLHQPASKPGPPPVTGATTTRSPGAGTPTATTRTTPGQGGAATGTGTTTTPAPPPPGGGSPLITILKHLL